MVTKAEHSFTFEAADIEHFAAFADWLAEHMPMAEPTFIEKPMFGGPYVQIDHREFFDRWTLMLDVGKTFNIGQGEAWISGGPK